MTTMILIWSYVAGDEGSKRMQTVKAWVNHCLPEFSTNGNDGARCFRRLEKLDCCKRPVLGVNGGKALHRRIPVYITLPYSAAFPPNHL